jgi:hypothetical protein
MSVEELKRALTSLSEGEQNELSAFLFHLRHQEAEQAEWSTLSARNLARAYSSDEPDYTESDIKHP